ncbi:hypothetical protein EYF80_022902 [Liparis tanakae]|uniref:Uncharacterized protein n=1 Tax=Liparis tanakae TaxID=230148 RepID=A0A4Z2HPC3_9TELE|nr:hypothetical protein EYF80_022902 [Liparis tanakae]
MIHVERQLACTGGIASGLQVGAFVLLVSDAGLSVLVPFVQWEGGVVVQVDSGQRLKDKDNGLKIYREPPPDRSETPGYHLEDKDKASGSMWDMSGVGYRVDRFISLATLWDMLTAATLLGSVIPIIPLPLQETRSKKTTRNEHDENHQQRRLHQHKHKQAHLRGQSQVAVPVVAGLQHLLLRQIHHQPPSEAGGGAAVDAQVRREAGGLTQQPGPQVEDAAVALPGVTVKGDGAGGQVVQEPVGEAGQPVIVETEGGGADGETGGQRGGSERPAAAVHLTAVTGAKATPMLSEGLPVVLWGDSRWRCRPALLRGDITGPCASAAASYSASPASSSAADKEDDGFKLTKTSGN